MIDRKKIEGVLQEGQDITVFVAGIDKQGRVKLEWKDKPQAENATATESTTTEVVDEIKPSADEEE